MANRRIFIAIVLPLQIQQELSRVIALLKNEQLCEGNYINPLTAHLTIQFIGLVPDSIIADLQIALQKISYPAFVASLNPLGCFEKKGHVAIIYAGINSPELRMFAAVLSRAVGPWLHQMPEQEFVGHITLLRIKKVYDTVALHNFLITTHVKPISWMINSFVLMKSVLKTEGPMYVPLREYPLVLSS